MICFQKLSVVSSSDNTSQVITKYRKLVYQGVLALLALIILFLIGRIIPNYQLVIKRIFKIILPFAISLLLTYLFNPLVNKISSRFIPRWLSILIIYLFFLLGMGSVFYFTYPTLREQSMLFLNQLPNIIEDYRAWIIKMDQMIRFLPEPIDGEVDELIKKLSMLSSTWLEDRVIGLGAISDYFISLAVVPVLLFFFLLDRDLIKMRMINWIPKQYQKRTRQFITHLNLDMAEFVRAQLLISLFVGLMSYLLYAFLKIDFAFILALFMALMNVIPYIGPFLGAIPAILIALTYSSSTALYTVLGILLIQVLEGNVLAPFLYSQGLRTHPIMVIFVLLVGSEFAGVIGMIFAVPILVVIRSVITYKPFQQD